MDEFSFEVETTTAKEMPIIVKDGRSAGVLRNTEAIGDAYAQRLEELRKLGYICIYNYSSNTGRHQNSTWLAPKSGWEGMKAWAHEMGAVCCEDNPPRIIVKEGAAGKFIGRGGETVRKIAAHCVYRGFVKIVEAKRKGGTRVVVRARDRAGENMVLAAEYHSGSAFSAWFELDGKIVGQECGNSCYECPPEFKGLPYNLSKKVLEVLECGGTLDPITSPFDPHSSDDIELAWMLLKELPGYAEARAKL